MRAHTHTYTQKRAQVYAHTHTHRNMLYIWRAPERQRDFTLSPQTKPIKSNTHGRRLCCRRRCRRLWLRLSLLPFVSLPLIAAAIGAIVCPQRPNKRSLAKKATGKRTKTDKERTRAAAATLALRALCAAADPADRVQSSSKAAEQLTSTATATAAAMP